MKLSTLVIIALLPFPFLQIPSVKYFFTNFTQSVPFGGWPRRFSVEQIPDMSGKVVIITGGNAGLGFESALELARKNAEVVIGCRDLKKGQRAVDDIKLASPNAKIRVLPLEMGSFRSIDTFVESFLGLYKKIDVLMLNAGKLFDDYSETEEGFESNMGVHHVGHAYLTFKLLPVILTSEKSRIVVVASHAHFSADGVAFDKPTNVTYKAMLDYSRSKLANILFARKLALELQRNGASNVLVNSLHPGFVITDFSWIQKTSIAEKLAFNSSDGALTQLYVAASPEVEEQHMTGEYFFPIGNRAVYGVDSSRLTTDWALIDRLWTWTLQAIAAHRPTFRPTFRI